MEGPDKDSNGMREKQDNTRRGEEEEEIDENVKKEGMEKGRNRDEK